MEKTFDLALALERFPLPKGTPDSVLNRGQCARALGVSENMITRYLADGLPCKAEGGNGTAYEFQTSEIWAWRKWRDAAEREAREDAEDAAAQLALAFRNTDPDAGEPEVFLSAKEVREESEADFARNKAAEMRRELVRAAQVRRMFENILGEVRQQFVTIVDFAELEFGLEPENVRKMQVRCDGTLIQMRQLFAERLPGEVANLAPHRPLDRSTAQGEASA